MKIQERIKQIRLEKRLTQKELAKKMGVTTAAISSWEVGRTSPTADSIVLLCKGLDVSADQLLGVGGHEKAQKAIFSASDDEIQMIRSFRFLDEFGKQSVLWILSHEKERVSADFGVDAARDNITYLDKVVGDRYIPKFLTPAAAGYSSTIDEADFEMLLVDRNVPQGADFAVVIQGDSMNPYIADGDTVYVKRAEEVSVGEIGIFSVNGAMYCKMFYRTGSGDIWLVSTNEELAASNVLVKAGSSDSFACMGKILLKERPKLPDYFMRSMMP